MILLGMIASSNEQTPNDSGRRTLIQPGDPQALAGQRHLPPDQGYPPGLLLLRLLHMLRVVSSREDFAGCHLGKK